MVGCCTCGCVDLHRRMATNVHRQENRIEVGAYPGIAAVFIFIAAYSRYLGLYWSRLLAGITATLGLLYLVEGVTGAMIGH